MGYRQNIAGTITSVDIDKTNTPVELRPPSRVKIKAIASGDGEPFYSVAPGETIVKVKAIGNTGIDAVIALQEAVTDTWVLGSSTAGTKMEDADEILGNFKYFKIYVNGTDATEARIWIAS